MKKKEPITMLIILDGFGYKKETAHNAIAQAHTPNLNVFIQQYPHTLLKASGNAVGLPDGYMGNSEVGHLTIGAGRILQESFAMINNAINNKNFFSNPRLISALQTLQKNGHTLHIMGLLSNTGIHSHMNHLFAFLDAAAHIPLTKIIIHAFLDGRDTPPQAATQFLNALEQKLKTLKVGTIGSLCGRSIAMDRNDNSAIIKQAYDCLTTINPSRYQTWHEAIPAYYKQGINDEFMPPTQLAGFKPIQNGDGIIFFNFRADRARELTAAFIDPLFTIFETKKINLTFFITPTEYDPHLKTTVLFKKKPIKNTLKEILNSHGKTIFSIAESEKYAHITYFFNGQNEQQFAHETRIVIPSDKNIRFDTKPEMKAAEITQAVLHSLTTNPCDFYLINYANPDMVGHTGNFAATIKAIECVDAQLGLLYRQLIEKMDGIMYITADHGNAEDKYNETTHQPITSHSTNPVPFIMIEKNINNKTVQLPLTQLADIAPFILQKMNLIVPDEMK